MALWLCKKILGYFFLSSMLKCLEVKGMMSETCFKILQQQHIRREKKKMKQVYDEVKRGDGHMGLVILAAIFHLRVCFLEKFLQLHIRSRMGSAASSVK